jgi:sigma-B regulation protein RsbU (phosphoserine phosphatase)
LQLLLIDPDSNFASALAAALKSTIDVSIADELMSPTPDLVICPLREHFIKLMSAAHEKGNTAQFAFVHTAVDDARVADALRDGAFHCILAPIDPATVRELVRRASTQRQAKEEAQRVRDRLARELAEGRRLQHAMMPPPVARISGMSIAVRCRPSAELGGDLVDYAEAGPDRAALLIADVAGHGLSAAMLTTLVKSAFRGAATSQFNPRDVAANVSAALQPFDDWRFVTLFAARVDRPASTIEYVNAGHPAGWIFQRGNTVAKLPATGPLLSSGVEGTPVAATAQIPHHAVLLLFTDGIFDATGRDSSVPFGIERFEEAVARGKGGGESLLDAIFASVDAFTGGHPTSDDMTALTLTIGVPGLA